MKKIRVQILGEEHSAGRGVGFYRSHLLTALKNSKVVEVVTQAPDLIHYPFFDLFYPTLPQKLKYPTVVTIHDLTPLVLKQFYPMGLRATLALARQRRALKNVSAVVTDSICSKKDIAAILHFPQEKIFVTPLAADPLYSRVPTGKYLQKVKEKYHLPAKFILYVGGVNPNKNLVSLAQAAIKINVSLVFVGSEFTKKPVETFSIKKILGLQPVHPEVKEFSKLQSIVEGNSLFHFPGYVPTEELNAIYRLASLYCQPSYYEGFGLPLLEAMTTGCPIVSANSGSLPEIYPRETVTFDPVSQGEIESAIQEVLSLKPKETDNLVKTGREKAMQFSWDNTARLTEAVYLSVISK